MNSLDQVMVTTATIGGLTIVGAVVGLFYSTKAAIKLVRKHRR